MNNIEKSIANVKATLAIEGLKPSKEAIEINIAYLEGKISSEDAIKKIIMYWSIESKHIV